MIKVFQKYQNEKDYEAKQKALKAWNKLKEAETVCACKGEIVLFYRENPKMYKGICVSCGFTMQNTNIIRLEKQLQLVPRSE